MNKPIIEMVKGADGVYYPYRVIENSSMVKKHRKSKLMDFIEGLSEGLNTLDYMLKVLKKYKNGRF
jgi:hypothetical protein